MIEKRLINALKIRVGKFMFSQSATPAKDLGGKVVIPAFFPTVARRFSIGRPQNYRMHTRGTGEGGRGKGEAGHTCASAGMDVFLASGIPYEYL